MFQFHLASQIEAHLNKHCKTVNAATHWYTGTRKLEVGNFMVSD